MANTNDSVKLIIGGDTCLINRTESIAISGNKENLFNNILPFFNSSDLVVLNLECPVIEEKTPILKGGPVLGANKEVINVLSESNISGLNLANNHILDHGEAGLKTTLAKCKQNGLFTFGAGKNLNEAREIKIINKNGVRIAFLGIAESEYSIATENSYGANPIDIIQLYSQIQSEKKNWDHLFVFLHGGNEHYPYPSPMLKKLCRHLVDLGASAVICQHSHIAGCLEEYKNALILYGQGNFLFDYPFYEGKYPAFYEGLLLNFSVTRDSFKYEVIPTCQAQGRVDIMDGIQKTNFVNSFEARSEEVLDDNILEAKWAEFCRSKKDLYMSILLGHNKYLNFINRKIGFVDKVYAKKSLMDVGNIIRCESHREVLLTIGNKL